MSWKDYPIFQREDGSFVIVINEAPYHVPNEGEWVELYDEVADFYTNNESSRADVEFQYIDFHPELLPPEPTLSEVKTSALSYIDSSAQSSILSGFDYEINGEILHFSYLAEDQQNFSDTFNGIAMKRLMSVEGLPETIGWNGWRNPTSNSKGELVRLNLDIDSFLALYTKGALAHKSYHMAIHGQRKEAIESAESIETINALLEEWRV